MNPKTGQRLHGDLDTLGQSITDACISWDMTVPVLEELASAVAQRRKQS